MSNVIEVEFPRKPADRGGYAYLCIRCRMKWVQEERLTRAVYCGCGGEVRPVEAK